MNRFSAHDVLHPLDRMARDNLEQIPGLRKASDLYLRSVDERAMRQSLMSSALRLSPTQLPRIYRLLPPICDAFGIDEPELYLAHSTEVNAWTFGQTRTSIVLYHPTGADRDGERVDQRAHRAVRGRRQPRGDPATAQVAVTPHGCGEVLEIVVW
jgi:hypothetical protein